MSAEEFGAPWRVDAILARAAATTPLRDAVVFGDIAWNYATVHERARRLAGGLKALGVGLGDRVALWAPNRAEFVEVFFGVPQLGAIIAPLDYWWHWNDALAALTQLRPKVLIVGPGQAEAVGPSLAALRDLGIELILALDEPPSGSSLRSYPALLARSAPLDVPEVVDAASPALILFTSGSTGRSKGAVHTHGGLVATAMTMAVELALGDGERTLHFLPLFSSCLEHLLPFTMVRATHVVLPRFEARMVWDVVRRAQITHFDAVPTILRRLLEIVPSEVPSTLRLVGYASERMPDQLIEALIDRLPGVRFVQFYGMIEHLCLTVLEPADQLRKIGTVGRPMFGARLRLVDGSGAPSARGEIVATSATMFAGYWDDPAATAMVLEDGWMHTGDLGRFDEDGFLILEGRIKEMIKTGGFTVVPAEVEAVLASHPAVRDAAVVGVPDAAWGEAVHAFVTLVPGAAVGAGELGEFCHDRLSGYKRPKVIQIVAELPRTGIGKIARRVVRDRVIADAMTERGG